MIGLTRGYTELMLVAYKIEKKGIVTMLLIKKKFLIQL